MARVSMARIIEFIESARMLGQTECRLSVLTSIGRSPSEMKKGLGKSALRIKSAIEQMAREFGIDDVKELEAATDAAMIAFGQEIERIDANIVGGYGVGQ